MLVVKNLPPSAGDLRDEGSRAPEEGNGYPLQYSCLENPMNGKSSSATVDGVPKSQTHPSIPPAVIYGGLFLGAL